jgi:hypothetical protein
MEACQGSGSTGRYLVAGEELPERLREPSTRERWQISSMR